MTSVAFPKSIFSELAANLPRHACRTGESITMSSKRSWLSVGITSFNGKISLIFLFLLLALPAFAAGGSCPSGANYLEFDGFIGHAFQPWRYQLLLHCCQRIGYK